ncbi:MAG: TRAP transporter substrate-binding protein [Clostridia bacterium]
MLKKRMMVMLALILVITLSVGCGGTSQPAPSGEKQTAEKNNIQPQTNKSIVLTLGHVVQEKTALDEGARYFAELVKQKTNGQITVEVHAAAVLGDNRVMLESMQLGTLDMMSPALAPISGFTDKTLLFDLPYLFKSEKAAEAVLDGPIGQQVLKELEPSGFIGLAWWTQSWRHITTKDRAVDKPADMKGIKIRVMDNPLHIAHFNAIGASAIPMAFSEVFTSLQQGVIDGQENPYVNIKLSGFNEVQKYVIETKHIYDPIPVLVSKITWEKLSPEQQKILTEAAIESSRWQRDYAAKQDEEIKKEFIDGGKTEIIELTPEERQAFFEAAQPVYKEWENKIGKDLIQKTLDAQKGF